MLPTPVSIEDGLSSKASHFITPKSLEPVVGKRTRVAPCPHAHVLLAKRRKRECPQPVQPQKSSRQYLADLHHRIKTSSMMCSWTQRKDKFLPMPFNKLEPAIMSLGESIMAQVHGTCPVVTGLLAESSKYRVTQADLQLGQRNRTVNREELITAVVLPIINAYGQHHETLFIAISILDRFLAAHYIHRTAQRPTAAAAATFLAIKFNEEFDPDHATLVAVVPSLETLSKRELLAMESKVVHALDWEVRPTTPHVLAYRLIDKIGGWMPFSVKRYLVNIVERIVCCAYASPEHHPDFCLGPYTLSALSYAYVLVHPKHSQKAIPKIFEVAGIEDGDAYWPPKLSLEQCKAYSYLPVIYGHPIQLI